MVYVGGKSLHTLVPTYTEVFRATNGSFKPLEVNAMQRQKFNYSDEVPDQKSRRALAFY